MKALGRRTKMSARDRKEEERLSQRTYDTMELLLYLMCISLNKRRGYGEQRCGETVTDIFDLLDYYTERYGSEYVVTAAKKELADRNIFIEIKGD
jgi:hypothetical protein